MNDKDKRWAETIIDYCNRIDDYLSRIDDDKEIYMSDNLIKMLCISYYSNGRICK